MTSVRATLTPQMLEYAEKFDDRGEIRWLPYLMYFHPANHRSKVVNTDRHGFRISHGAAATASAGSPLAPGAVRLLVGSSTVFGIGATSDAATLASRLWSKHAPDATWLNFGGRSFNPTQELMLFVLYRHLLSQVTDIVIFSGFNALGLSRLPAPWQGDHGAFFNCGDYLEKIHGTPVARALAESSKRGRRPVRRPPDTTAAEAGGAAGRHRPPDLDQQIGHAVDLTIRHLATWRLVAAGMEARLTFVLQPLATWVRHEPATQERALFDELDAIADFGAAYGDIATMDAGREYAARLGRGCARLDVPFLDMSPALAEVATQDQWLFVDRIHFTDEGNDVVAGLLAERLGVSAAGAAGRHADQDKPGLREAWRG